MRLIQLGVEILKFILEEILKPILRRLGTSVGVFLTTVGASSELATQVEVVLPTVLGLFFDLAWSHRNRMVVVRDALR